MPTPPPRCGFPWAKTTDVSFPRSRQDQDIEVLLSVCGHSDEAVHFPLLMSASNRARPKIAWVQGDTESRRHLRESPLDLVLKNPIRGHIVDISRSGIGLESSSPLVPLTQQKFTIGLGAGRASVLGEIRWCKLAGTRTIDKGESEPVYRAGVALLEAIVLS